jgi:hypothetical protein
MNRLNNEKDPRTKRAFAHAAIAEAKRKPVDPELAHSLYERVLAAADTRKGAGLPDNAVGVLGVQAAFQEGLEGLDSGHLSSRFFMTRHASVERLHQAALNVAGLDIRKLPRSTPEDYRHVLAAQRAREAKLSQNTNNWPELSIEELAELHFKKGSTPLEITYDENGSGSPLTQFWDEYRRLELETGPPQGNNHAA